jgi:hypothetical protein
VAGVDLHELEVELRRVSDRLDSMPLGRAASAADACRAAAAVILAGTRDLDPAVPADARLPDLGPHGLGSMIRVLGGDYLTAARAAGDADPGPVLDALVTLRRALP